ncbi:zf-HC2 domain-containing protein [Myxococcota bacterium]|nr:zf-HC2 domain-containing protein [Myxococcota bacterium]
MNCNHVQDLLPLYAENELDAATARGVKDHLETCEQCTSALVEFDRVDALFQSVTLPPVPSSLSTVWEVALEQREVPSGGRRTIRWAVFAVTAALMVLIGSFTLLHGRGGGSDSPKTVTAKTITADLGATVVIAVRINNEKTQDLGFTVQLTGGMRFLGEGLRIEEELLMRWSDRLEAGERKVLIPLRTTLGGDSEVVITVRSVTGEIEKRLSFHTNNAMVAQPHVPVLATIIL